MKDPKVIIITINYNQNEYTVECIFSILKSNYNNFQIILIDNGSEYKKYLELEKKLPKDERIILERIDKNIGYVGGINQGLEKAAKLKADYFLIMNNDTIIDSNAIKELVGTSETHNRKAIISGKIYNYDEKDTLQYIGQAFDEKGMLNQKSIVKNRREKDIGQYDKEMEMGMLDDIFWLIPKNIFEIVGKYSDYFFLYGEQNDYAFRAIKEGFKLFYTPNAKLWHKGAITTCNGNKKSAARIYWITFATLKLSVLHLSRQNAKSFYRKWVLRNTIKNTLLFLTGKINFSIVKAHFLAIYHFHHWNIIRYKDNGYNPFIVNANSKLSLRGR